ncbi:unnamed protein product [Arabidopsis thaliana]|uniref:Bifunctional inhibitor/lipid-transfer protein/seed storage 2S albumin superfamily protein n=3 Tax=Arabidopsis thaliana TaxID=3702 RepID=Q1PDH3_ARATH|nr:Bifunctional inhibitor/lipid-transfer protein/seed storage 2S albumin superfamily protein [Arabidopsis thaliana]ABE65587.1 hypothetical protein At5g59330 [Arabidopsis thaliana]AED97172.1 Bifunctional inhibitor/lipid-transfer protein/seed storage 2S albumin superfamily protein [Arabidopsis thaliana]VYS70855.1 unnamed protein product [Arabidopsis thaliana]|eukprot:NP_200741.2 Bifunctional inhibitor/lipid-transfer protein/seed storage 2S albumin superfamily protein [Arabidopsis thaliana]
MALALRFFICFVLTVCIVSSVDAEISCGTVVSNLAPCANYLSKGGVVPDLCCEGVEKLNGVAQTMPMPTVHCKGHFWSQPKSSLWSS